MACNPVAQYNDFTGDGTTVDFTFTFPYLNKTEVQVRFGEYPNYTYPDYTTEYTVSDANPTVVTFVTAPADGEDFRIFRCTDGTNLPATFQAGSAIRAADLNDNFEQMLYLVQDANVRSEDTQIVGDDAYDRSVEALNTANQALDNSEEAIETAERAEGKADAALDIVASQIAGVVVQNVGELPATGASDLLVYTVIDSTGIENFSPLTGLPPGFVGDNGMSVKLQWQQDYGTYIFLSSQATDSDHRYVQVAGDNMTGNLTIDTDKVVLNKDGSATFASGLTNIYSNGTIRVKDNPGNSESYGIDLNDNGKLRVRSSVAEAVSIYPPTGTDTSIELYRNGDADFIGDITINTFDDSSNDGFGAKILKDGNIAVQRTPTQGSSSAFTVKKGIATTCNINADGSATFAGGDTQLLSNGVITSNRTDTADAGAVLQRWSQQGTSRIEFLGNGSATFAGDVAINGATTIAGNGLAVKGSAYVFSDTSSSVQTLKRQSGANENADYLQCRDKDNALDISFKPGGSATFAGSVTVDYKNFTSGNQAYSLFIGENSTSKFELGAYTTSNGTPGTFYNKTGNAPFLYKAKGTSKLAIANDGSVRIGGSVEEEGIPDPNIKLKADGSATFTGNVGIGTTSPLTDREGNSNRIASIGVLQPASQSGLVVITNQTSSNDAVGGRISVQRFVDASTSVLNNDELGSIVFGGSTGDGSTTCRNAAQITAFVDDTPGSNVMPGRLVFSTTADGASTPTERMRIDSSGNVGIGTDPAKKLDVAGDIRTTGTGGIYILSDRSVGSGDRFGIYADDNALRVYDFATSTDRVTLKDGNVGIGGNAPDSPNILLGGAGNATFAGQVEAKGGIKFGDGTSMTTAATGGGTPANMVTTDTTQTITGTKNFNTASFSTVNFSSRDKLTSQGDGFQITRDGSSGNCGNGTGGMIVRFQDAGNNVKVGIRNSDPDAAIDVCAAIKANQYNNRSLRATFDGQLFTSEVGIDFNDETRFHDDVIQEGNLYSRIPTQPLAATASISTAERAVAAAIRTAFRGFVHNGTRQFSIDKQSLVAAFTDNGLDINDYGIMSEINQTAHDGFDDDDTGVSVDGVTAETYSVVNYRALFAFALAAGPDLSALEARLTALENA